MQASVRCLFTGSDSHRPNLSDAERRRDFFGRSRLIYDASALLTATDLVCRIKTGQNKFNTRSTNRFIFTSVHLERLVPHWRYSLDEAGVVRRRQHIADFDLDAA